MGLTTICSLSRERRFSECVKLERGYLSTPLHWLTGASQLASENLGIPLGRVAKRLSGRSTSSRLRACYAAYVIEFRRTLVFCDQRSARAFANGRGKMDLTQSRIVGYYSARGTRASAHSGPTHVAKIRDSVISCIVPTA